MGNKVSVRNQTGKKLTVLSFNNSDILYLHYTDMRLIRVNGCIDLHGLAGGNAVKVGVVYDMHDKYLVYDLFRVRHKSTLTVQGADENGVKWGFIGIVKLLRQGKLISVTADQAEAIRFGFSLTGDVIGSAAKSAVAARSSFS